MCSASEVAAVWSANRLPVTIDNLMWFHAGKARLVYRGILLAVWRNLCWNYWFQVFISVCIANVWESLFLLVLVSLNLFFKHLNSSSVYVCRLVCCFWMCAVCDWSGPSIKDVSIKISSVSLSAFDLASLPALWMSAALCSESLLPVYITFSAYQASSYCQLLSSGHNQNLSRT